MCRRQCRHGQHSEEEEQAAIAERHRGEQAAMAERHRIVRAIAAAAPAQAGGQADVHAIGEADEVSGLRVQMQQLQLQLEVVPCSKVAR